MKTYLLLWELPLDYAIAPRMFNRTIPLYGMASHARGILRPAAGACGMHTCAQAGRLGRVRADNRPALNCGATARSVHEHSREAMKSPQARRSEATPSALPGQGKSTPNRSLERGLDLLRAFRPGSEYLTNGELSERTGLSRSTVSRLTQTLVRAGFLDYHPPSGAYRLACSLLSLAHSLYHGSSLVRVAAPLMRQVARQLQVNVGLAAADGDEMVYLESIRLGTRKSPRTIASGQRLPMELTALGRASLATQDEAQRRSLLAHFQARRCAARWATLSEEIEAAMRSVESLGYCAASWQPQVVSIAMPLDLPGYRGHALNISLSTREGIDRVSARYGQPLLQLAQAISSELSAR